MASGDGVVLWASFDAVPEWLMVGGMSDRAGTGGTVPLSVADDGLAVLVCADAEADSVDLGSCGTYTLWSPWSSDWESVGCVPAFL